LIALALTLSACANDTNTEEVFLFAASSLTEVMTQVAAEYNAANPEVEIKLNFAGSATLREQLLGGAKADVVMVANSHIMDDLVAADAVLEPAIAASNQMVLVVPVDNPANITALSDLDRESLLVGLCSKGVPCGMSARQILANAGVSVSLDTNEPNVKSLLAKISQGELDAGIVYVTDLGSSASPVSSIAIDPAQNETNQYPIASVAGSSNPAAAAAFVRFVISEIGQQAFLDSGFLVSRAPADG
jgi:molybdate transport system substrate-binding protein